MNEVFLLMRGNRFAKALITLDDAHKLLHNVPLNEPLFESCEELFLYTNDGINNTAGITIEDAIDLFNKILYELPSQLRDQIVKPRPESRLK